MKPGAKANALSITLINFMKNFFVREEISDFEDIVFSPVKKQQKIS
jgi:hypothetical protein